MEELRQRIEEGMDPQRFIMAVLSDLSNKGLSTFVKLTIRPFLNKGEVQYQLAYDYEKKVLHKNVTLEEAKERVLELMGSYFKQMTLFTSKFDLQVLYHKKRGYKFIESDPSKLMMLMAHNRVKQYILKEGTPVDFMVALGIMNKEGKVLNDKHHKFKQINKFLEFIEDAAKQLPNDRPLKILDFGCGKAYLSFATYFYFTQIRKQKVQVIGLDLKAEVIQNLNHLVETLGYQDLQFFAGDIRQYVTDGEIDVMISLHACDTATDYAIAKAIEMKAQAILAVPCCQHEIFGQLKKESNPLLYKHGIVKERFAALLTDALRATALEVMGYETEIVEFIDMEHTPKNMLLRAYKKTVSKRDARDRYENDCLKWGVKPSLGQLLAPLMDTLEK